MDSVAPTAPAVLIIVIVLHVSVAIYTTINAQPNVQLVPIHNPVQVVKHALLLVLTVLEILPALHA